ncbi:cyclic nucleotide-binding domain-containing protein, partial [Citrobacter sp. TBCS-15]
LAIVAHGTLKIYQLSSAGKEQLLRVIEPGGYAGEDALFGVMNDNLYGETLEETQICFLRQQDFKNLLLKYPE